jgi:polyhydroxyalkanoate synthesis repressor PhaR
MVTIKKYNNRRLYDTRASRYVNLDEIAAMIQGGETIRVVDATSEDDLTRPVLVQVLLERHGALDVIPPGLLHRIIRATGGLPIHRAMLQPLGAALAMIETQIEQLERTLGIAGWDKPHDPSPDDVPEEGEEPEVPPKKGKASAGKRPSSAAKPPPAPGPAPAPPPTPGPAASHAAPDREMDALRERLAALEKRLGGR